MAKGLRAKSLRRYRTAKRHVITETVELPRLKEANKKVKLLQRGIDITPKIKPNKFLEPDNPEAVIPQRVVKPAIDLRSEAVPLSGLAGMYNRRKFDDEEIRSSAFLAAIKKDIISNNDEIAMDTDQVASVVTSTGREGGYKRGKAHAHAQKKLNAIKKHRK
ncbi:hypothetical protein BgAZ_302730 [Babesia gibsoni]|uniref:Uncharacterized protein n=1 Tax=Babesia gibsoni TaxID=33632 RepID=A0AAD8P8S1_BABGI|nr:hypothetical protein BgAZ_302730 [Babesia gibsoni]